MFTPRLVLPRVMTWTEKRGGVTKLPRSQKHTRAHHAAVVIVGDDESRLVLVLLLLVLPTSTLVFFRPYDEKT